MKPTSLLTVCLLSLSTLAFAQAPSGDGAKPQPPQQPKARFDCSQAKDPKACEGKQGPERRECMRHEMCAQSKDPKGCEAHAAKMKAAMQAARKACEGKPAAERRDCVRQEMHKQEK